MVHSNDKVHPSVKENVRRQGASLKKQIVTAYEDTKQLAIDQWNHFLSMNSDVTVDSVIESINYILDIVQPVLDAVMAKYTNYTGQEVRYMCNRGFQLVRLYQ